MDLLSAVLDVGPVRRGSWYGESSPGLVLSQKRDPVAEKWERGHVVRASPVCIILAVKMGLVT